MRRTGALRKREAQNEHGAFKTYKKTNIDDFIFEIKESVYVTTDMVDMGDIDVCYDEFE